MINAILAAITIVLVGIDVFHAASLSNKPIIITSSAMLHHRPPSYHPECPERLSECLTMIDALKTSDAVHVMEPTGVRSKADYVRALDIIYKVHDRAYVDEVQLLCSKGARSLSPWDADTYISKSSFDACVIAQSCWLDGIDLILTRASSGDAGEHDDNNSIVFALTRPPGHHALHSASMGFCIFNFAAGAIRHAIDHYGVERVSVLDFDVHYGNGVADLIEQAGYSADVRYCSLHQRGIFPIGEGEETHTGKQGNILNIPLRSGCTWPVYQEMLLSKAIPFLKENKPQLLIVCAGYDALSSDETAELSLTPPDYELLSTLLKATFGNEILFGLEGGYSLKDLPSALKSTLLPFMR